MKKTKIILLVCLMTLLSIVPAFALEGDNYTVTFSNPVGEGTAVSDGYEIKTILVKKGTVLTLETRADMSAGCMGGSTFNSMDFMDPMVWNGTDLVNYLDGNTTNTLEFNWLGPHLLFLDDDEYIIEVVEEVTDEQIALYKESAAIAATIVDEPDTWAQSFVDKANELNLLPKKLDKKYKNNITRAEFCNLIIQLVETKSGMTAYELIDKKGLQFEYPFIDTFDERVSQAYILDIVGGKGDDMFDPKGLLTRQEAAIILMKTAKALDHDITLNDSTFADASDIDSWALEGINYVSSNDIMNGVGENKFAPKATYTRQQAIVTIIKLYDALQ